MKALLVLTLSLISSLSMAQAEKPMNARELAKFYQASNCDQECQRNVTVEFFNASNMHAISSDLRKKLDSAAFNQAQIWGDTILEGEYFADGKTDLDEVIVIMEDSRVVGYAITYSERAWYLGNCNFEFGKPETLATCDEGRISERSFLATSLKDAEVDENKFADFTPNE